MSRGKNKQFSIAGLVWTLAILGIAAGAVDLLVGVRTRQQIHAVNTTNARVRDKLRSSTNRLRDLRELLSKQTESLLHRNRPAAGSMDFRCEIESAVDFAKQAYQTSGDSNGANIALLERIHVDLVQLLDWNVVIENKTAAAVAAERSRETALLKARDTIRGTIASVEQAVGMSRLATIRTRRNQTDTVAVADAIVDSQRFMYRTNSLKVDLHELALLVERLVGTSTESELANQKDNQFRQIFARLRRQSRSGSDDHAETFDSHLHQIAEAVFGLGARDDAAHQTMLVGQGGLFAAQQEFLRTRQVLRDLHTRAHEAIAQCATNELAFATMASDLNSRDFEQGLTVLQGAERNALSISGTIMLLFMLLAGFIAQLGQRTEEELQRSNRILKDARAKAEAASIAKGDFLANMSHEIRTPMTAILGFADELLTEEGLDRAPPHRVMNMQTIRRNGEHLLQVINDILDMSKIEAGKMQTESIDCSPHEILRDVQQWMQVRADTKRLDWHVELDGPLPLTIKSDPTRLRQILVNLVGNAIKFTETGSVRLIARFSPQDATLSFAVIDTGIGMSRDQQENLFAPFHQADNSVARRFGGTGLGLAISKHFAEKLGGRITVASQQGCGSQFTVTIDTGSLGNVELCADLQGSLLAGSKDEIREFTNATRPLADRRVLLLEDGPDNQRLLSFILKKAGATVEIAENGKIGLDCALKALADGHPFDVILADMQMPVMDGYSATRELRKRGYEGPIIALTALAMSSDRQKCLDAGCDDYVTKPIDRTELIAKVAQYAQGALAAI